MPRSCASPDPIRSPTTTSPVAMPTRVCSGALGLQRSHRCDQLQPRPHRPLGVVLMGLRIAEIDEHAVAHVFRHEPAEALHGLGDAFLIGRNDLAQVLRVHARRERRRADKVREHHRDLAAFGAVIGCGAMGAAGATEGFGASFATALQVRLSRASNIRRCPSAETPNSLRSSSVRSGRTETVMSFSAKCSAYCPRPSVSSQSAICCVAELRCAAALGTMFRFSFDALLIAP